MVVLEAVLTLTAPVLLSRTALSTCSLIVAELAHAAQSLQRRLQVHCGHVQPLDPPLLPLASACFMCA
jgi:hypothetical protein